MATKNKKPKLGKAPRRPKGKASLSAWTAWDKRMKERQKKYEDAMKAYNAKNKAKAADKKRIEAIKKKNSK